MHLWIYTHVYLTIVPWARVVYERQTDRQTNKQRGKETRRQRDRQNIYLDTEFLQIKEINGLQESRESFIYRLHKYIYIRLG